MANEKRLTVHLIYVHGFRGDHTSFQSFPTDLHERVLTRLKEDERGLGKEVELNSCLYPTYKSRKRIEVVTGNFMGWLETLEPPGPVILLAHSMGGLLAADAATGWVPPTPTHTPTPTQAPSPSSPHLNSTSPPHQNPSSNSTRSPKPNRISHLIAFDVPYLGMHPHVVVSGIKSLFQGEAGEVEGEIGRRKFPHEEGRKTEGEVNDAGKVEMVGREVLGEDREGSEGDSRSTSNYSQNSSYFPPPTSPPSLTSYSTSSLHTHASSLSSSPTLSSLSSLSPKLDHLLTASPKLSGLLASTDDLLTKAQTLASQHSDDALVKFLRKHREEPVGAAKRWVVEGFQFGYCAFDVRGLVERYRRLEGWGGGWVNFWTETAGGMGGEREGGEREREEREGEEEEKEASPRASEGEIFELVEAEEAGLEREVGELSLADEEEVGSAEPESERVYGPRTKEEDKAERKRRKEEDKLRAKEEKRKAEESKRLAKRAEKQTKEEEKRKLKEKQKEKSKEKEKEKVSPRHFITLPGTLNGRCKHRWERVPIAGARDEVEAHCGLFIRERNTEYERFVDRVAQVVVGWSRELVIAEAGLGPGSSGGDCCKS